MLTDNPQNQGTPNGLIGSLVVLIGALSAYIFKLKAGISRMTGKKVSVDEVVRSLVHEEMKKVPWEEPAREAAMKAARYAVDNSAAFADLNQRIEAMEFRQTREKNEIMRGLDELKRGLADVQEQLRA